MKRFLLFLLLAGCATPPPTVKPCKLYQPPRGWCAYTDAQ